MNDIQPIAVVGMAGVFPGADTLQELWNNIINKKSSISEVPRNRWIASKKSILSDSYETDKACSAKAGLIHNFKFDPSGFNIDEKLLLELDPLYHLVLQSGKNAFSSCRSNPETRKNTGVILAAIALPTDSSSFLTRQIHGKTFKNNLFGCDSSPENESISSGQLLAAKVTSLPASILCASLGLGGGSYTLDAACSSSLYAIKLACDELRSGRRDIMLAGGVSRPDCLFTQIGFSQLQALSPTGRCAPFDESANGLVVGEGAGVITLKRLDDAIRDGDTIHGVIHGIGLSNDMGGNLLAPDSEGQVRAMKKAYELSGWAPEDIDHIECHGAGTPLGDSVELTSLNKLWENTDWKEGQCAIGSIKSMTGHLLTAAGIAGFIKTLLALKNKTIPPSLNYKKHPDNSPLKGSPFGVRTEPVNWIKKSHRPRRAAVSAFGFGGINGHLLIEEWDPDYHQKWKPPISQKKIFQDIAITGMETHFGKIENLHSFRESVFNGDVSFSKRGESRWAGNDEVASGYIDSKCAYGNYIDEFSVGIGEFHIPPNEIPEILPQHILMLKVAAGALKDAKLNTREAKSGMGAVIGIDFDYESTNYHLRWNVENLISEYEKKSDIHLSTENQDEWINSLKEQASPPLTSPRTVGALGGIVASRIAKEFKMGGPSYAVSCEEASGIKALEIGIRSLQQGETDTFLAGSVDFAGDLRSIIIKNSRKKLTDKHIVAPFDREADGSLLGEGASAVVLKRYEDALKDGDKIYAVIKGSGSSSDAGPLNSKNSRSAYNLSITRCLSENKFKPSDINYLELHGSGNPEEDSFEAEAIDSFFSGSRTCCGIGSTKGIIGDTGASSGLASFIKTALSLYHEVMPGIPNYKIPGSDSWNNDLFHIPNKPQYWFRNRADGPLRACCASVTTDGNYTHLIMESDDSGKSVKNKKSMPLIRRDHGLFILSGENKSELISRLDELQHLISLNTDIINIDVLANKWAKEHRLNPKSAVILSIVTSSVKRLTELISDSRNIVKNDSPSSINGSEGINYSPSKLRDSGKIAFVFPGSGNHYLGMGSKTALYFPEILHKMSRETAELKTQLIPSVFLPQRLSWEKGWENEAVNLINSHPHYMIFGQVVHGGVLSNLVRSFDINPAAVIGYSLGESAGNFALEAWPERGNMLERMKNSELFTNELAGTCISARKSWNFPDDKDFKWKAALVNRPKDVVNDAISKYDFVRLLIVNTQDECVIGGNANEVNSVIKQMGCGAIFLDGVVTVHCDAAKPSEKAYRDLHLFPTKNVSGIDFYSCYKCERIEPTTDNAADSIIGQTLYGFDYSQTILKAYEDGIRIFLEMGPQNSCSRMISRILHDKPHMAISACNRNEDDYLTLLKFLGSLAAEGVNFNLKKLYNDSNPELDKNTLKYTKHLTIKTGRKSPSKPILKKEQTVFKTKTEPQAEYISKPQEYIIQDSDDLLKSGITEHYTLNDFGLSNFDLLHNNDSAKADAHKSFLEFSRTSSASLSKAIGIQAELIENAINTNCIDALAVLEQVTPPDTEKSTVSGQPLMDDFNPEQFIPEPVYDRDMCMEFAVGSVGIVLGDRFSVVDTYKKRVRLPDEPLMLVDRITAIEGEKGSLTSGKIVTEHDVSDGAWYLDGGRAPACISIEAGQADLFLSSYLGIDLIVKGTRSYRLLDAVASFHRGLPEPGDTIRYEIEIEKFIKQNETYLFFFNFKGFIRNELLITMRDGCAGFFTDEEVKNSGGIILTDEDRAPLPGKTDSGWSRPVEFTSCSLSDNETEALRKGDLEKGFGRLFKGIVLAKSLRLPGGKMKLVNRVKTIDPDGGRYSLGIIKAEADILPDDWFLTCHFVDDMVMPGTLMYECCCHTLRIFLLRLGWVSEQEGVCIEPVPGVDSRLKCRGPVTPDTKSVLYEVEIKELGYNPEPYAIADAHMYADGREIVMFRDMTMKVSGLSKGDVELFWSHRSALQQNLQSEELSKIPFGRENLLSFATGKPSEAFGPQYKPFDHDRFIARLPGPPFLLMDRVISAEPEQWLLKPGGWIVSEYDVDPGAWYFRANAPSFMPFSILLEIALQPCGWLAAYMGSALKSENDLKFRNLGGNATQLSDIPPTAGKLVTRAKLEQFSSAGDMIIESFKFEVYSSDNLIYSGDTTFGFFTYQSLENQVGITEKSFAYNPTTSENEKNIYKVTPYEFEPKQPISPDDESFMYDNDIPYASDAIRMIDRITTYIPEGGPYGLGFIQGEKDVNPDEWFFKAHFYQDPVCPGSLGVESFIQLLRFASFNNWTNLSKTHRVEPLTGIEHKWTYRGQIIGKNKKAVVSAIIKKIGNNSNPEMIADGYLSVDGLLIYKMENFGIRLVPIDSDTRTTWDSG